MLSGLYIFISLFVCYYIFSGINEPFFIATGVISSFLGVYVAYKMKYVSNYPHFSPRFFRYLGWLLKEIVLSTIEVIKQVWKAGAHVDGHFDTIKTKQKTPLGYTILGNSITLTPGTVTVRIDDDKSKIIVHALGKNGLKALHDGHMDKRVLKAVEE